MAVPHSDLTHLASLIEAAEAQAGRLGGDLRAVSRLLADARAAVSAIDANGGSPDEGTRLEDLTTDNDK